MRTTLAIDDDVLLAVQEQARREKRSAGRVLSDLARASLNRVQPGAESARTRHGFAVLESRGGVVSNALIDRLREDEPE